MWCINIPASVKLARFTSVKPTATLLSELLSISIFWIHPNIQLLWVVMLEIAKHVSIHLNVGSWAIRISKSWTGVGQNWSVMYVKPFLSDNWSHLWILSYLKMVHVLHLKYLASVYMFMEWHMVSSIPVEGFNILDWLSLIHWTIYCFSLPLNACTGRGLFRVGVTFEIHVSQTVMNLVILIEDEEFSSARSINTMDIKSLHFTFNLSYIEQ